jgi:hypothetical protein
VHRSRARARLRRWVVAATALAVTTYPLTAVLTATHATALIW